MGWELGAPLAAVRVLLAREGGQDWARGWGVNGLEVLGLSSGGSVLKLEPSGFRQEGRTVQGCPGPQHPRLYGAATLRHVINTKNGCGINKRSLLLC